MNKYRVTWADGFTMDIMATNEIEARYKAKLQTNKSELIVRVYYII